MYPTTWENSIHLTVYPPLVPTLITTSCPGQLAATQSNILPANPNPPGTQITYHSAKLTAAVQPTSYTTFLLALPSTSIKTIKATLYPTLITTPTSAQQSATVPTIHSSQVTTI